MTVYSGGKGTKEPLGSENWPSGMKKSSLEKYDGKPHPCGWSLSGRSDYNLVCPEQIGGSKKYREEFDRIFGKRCVKCRQKECRCE